MDNEFEPMRADLMDAKVNLNVASNNEHVPEIERHIRTVKDRVRCMYNSVPFKKMPSRMIVEMVTSATFWLNMFPPRDGISKTISPRGIIHGLTVDYNKHCQLEFGSYAQVDEEHDNLMQTAAKLAGPYSSPGAMARLLRTSHTTKLTTPMMKTTNTHPIMMRATTTILTMTTMSMLTMMMTMTMLNKKTKTTMLMKMKTPMQVTTLLALQE